MADGKPIIIDSPLEHRSEQVHGYYDSQDLNPDHIRLVGRSDISLSVTIRFTCNKDDESQGVKQTLRFPAEFWRSEKIELQARYFYIVLKKVDGNDQVSKDLYFEIFSPRSKVSKESSFKTLDVVEEKTCMSPVIQTRSSSPFAKKSGAKFFLSKERRKSHMVDMPTSSTMLDFRLPSFVPKGAILVGGKNGKVEIVAKPHCGGLYLMSDEDGNFEWRLPYNFSKREIE
jgi:hypothetical protein